MSRIGRLESDVRLTRRRLEELGSGGAGDGRSFLDSPEDADFKPPPVPVPPSAVNQLRNGDFSHSVRTWNNGAAGNQDYECAHWFTHDAPVAAQQLDESTGYADLNVDADANAATNKTLKSSSHASYNTAMCAWDRAHGVASLQGTKSLDAPLPSNTATPNAGQICLGMRAALKNSYVVVPSGFRLFAGVWDNTAGQRDWVKASSSFALTRAATRGTPGATVERRYKVYLYTDRGYTYLSAEATVLNAPADGQFSSTVDVYLEWPLIPGVLEAHIYRYTPGTGAYALLEKTSANTYADNGVTVSVSPPVAAYPTATDDRSKAYVATASGALDDLAVDGVDSAWDSLFLNIPVPSGYNMGVTTDKQWLRIGQNMALDRRVTDAVVNNGSATLTSATAAFTSLDTGRTATVTAGANTATVTLTYVNATTVTMSAAWAHASATGATLYVTGGGDQGLLLDQVHASYVSGAVYAPHPQDLDRPLAPAAAPNGSSQGGVGSGGSGGAGEGGVACVEETEPVCVFEGDRVVAVCYKDVRPGQAVFTGDVRRSRVMKKMRGRMPLLLLRAENGVELVCSPSHRVITTRNDSEGRPVDRLRAGDSVLTYLRGRVEVSRVSGVWDLGTVGEVGTFRLSPGCVYVAGRYEPAGWRARLRLWLRGALGRPEEPAGILSHNLKRETF